MNKLTQFRQTQPEMHVYLNFYVHTNHKDSKKPYVINVYFRWHLAPSEAGLVSILVQLAITYGYPSSAKKNIKQILPSENMG